MRAFVVFATLTLAVTLANAAAPIATLTTVDEFERLADSKISITGIPAGQSTAQTYVFNASNSRSASALAVGDACERAALMMLTRPGRYQLQINGYTFSATCRLIKQ